MLEKRSNLGWGWYDSKSKPKDATKPISPNSDTLQYKTICQPRYTKMPKISRSPSIEENSITYVTVGHKKTQAQERLQYATLAIGEESPDFPPKRFRSVSAEQGNSSIAYAKVGH